MPETVCDGEQAAPARAPVPYAAWELPAEAATVATIRGGVREFARAHGASKPLLIDLALAVTEAVTNGVVHAFVGREPGTITTTIRAGVDELSVTVTDDGRGMQPRADSPGLGLGLPTIASLTTSMDMHAPPGGGTALTMSFTAPGVRGPARAAVHEAELLEQVARTVEGTWPGEGVERLVDLLVPDLADACALDAMDASGQPQRFAGRIDGPDGARQSAWLASLKPRTDAPSRPRARRSTTAACTSPSSRPSTIAGTTFGAEDAAQMAGHRRALVGRGPARRRRPPARPARLRPASRERGADLEQLHSSAPSAIARARAAHDRS